MKAGYGADCDAAERDVHRPASHAGGPQALSKFPSAESVKECPWEERETVKEICGLPAGAKREGVVLQPHALCCLGHGCNQAGKQMG